MKFSINRDIFLPAVQSVIGAIERRQTLPILSNLLIQVLNNRIIITATDLEIELKNTISLEGDSENFEFTLPARKIADICKNIEEGSSITFNVSQENTIITTNRSKFTLSILPSTDYPKIDDLKSINKFKIEQNKLKKIINNVSFAMAQQDVRYYLNGVLFDLNHDKFAAVTTDGHRLALSETSSILDIAEEKQVIIPRKTVIELQKLLGETSEIININIDSNHIQFNIGDIVLTSKIIDGKFPDYKRVIPANNDKLARINKDSLKHALVRSAIISNEKFKGAKFNFTNNLLVIETQNSERENSKEDLVIDYTSDDLTIGFNISYILDVLNINNNECIDFELKSTDTSCVIRMNEPNDIQSIYVVMPMRI
jgi:DNA polymerase-3 subunit beta